MSAEIHYLNLTRGTMEETLLDLLEWVRAEQVTALCFVATTVEDCVLSASIVNDNVFMLLGGVTDMQRTITDKIERR